MLIFLPLLTFLSQVLSRSKVWVLIPAYIPPFLRSTLHYLYNWPAPLSCVVGRLGDQRREKESARGTVGRGKRGSCFSIIAIFIGIPSGSLRGGQREGSHDPRMLPKSLKVWYLIFSSFKDHCVSSPAVDNHVNILVSRRSRIWE